MKTSIIGFDPSLTSYGVSDGERHVRFRTKPEMGDTFARVRAIFAQISVFLETHPGPKIFVVEGPSFNSHRSNQGGTALWDAGYLRAHLDSLANSRGVGVIVVPPASLKKFVTGKGNTPKKDMPLRVFRKWNIEFEDDPEGDKLHAYCLHRYGLAVAAAQITHVAPKPRGGGRAREESHG